MYKYGYMDKMYGYVDMWIKCKAFTYMDKT